MKRSPLGTQELAILRHIAEAGPLAAGQVAEAFGGANGLARSTVLTVMERLRAKGYLERRKRKGVYLYASRSGAAELLQGVVGQFVQRALRGSVAPLAAYLAERTDVSDEELAELEALVRKLKRGRAS
jgi:predicted transcriptional regulator